MSTYIIFYGKPSSMIFYCYDYNGKVTELNSLLRDSYILESELFYEDNRNNKDVFSKYLFEDSKGNKYSILKLFSKIKKNKHKNFGLTYLAINNGSSDQSLNLIKKHKIKYINLKRNYGVGYALMSGYLYAKKNRYYANNSFCA